MRSCGILYFLVFSLYRTMSVSRDRHLLPVCVWKVESGSAAGLVLEHEREGGRERDGGSGSRYLQGSSKTLKFLA